jgi:iron uptake system component EfeO
MNRSALRIPLLLAACSATTVLAGGCGASEDPPPGAKKLSFELTDEGCLPHSTSAPAGPIAFEVENTGTSAVTEIEIMKGDSILGEKENLSDGLSGSFTLTLDGGEYTIYCPGGEEERGTLTVTGKAAAASTSAASEKDAVN